MNDFVAHITEPGVYEMSAEEYHADPVAGGSLSSTASKELLACPAKFAYGRTHPRPSKKEFDLGHAAHRMALGKGAVLKRVIGAENWMTKAAKEAKADAHAEGKVPLLDKDWAQVEAMYAVLRQHWAASLFRGGVAEQVLVWHDESTGIMCRAMLDYRCGAWVVDYKTTVSADPNDWDDTVARYGYDLQGAHYVDGVRTLGLADEPAFFHVIQEKEPPHLITVSNLSPAYLEIGAAKAARARALFRDCTASGVWPGYPGTDDVILTNPPRWVRNQEQEY